MKSMFIYLLFLGLFTLSGESTAQSPFIINESDLVSITSSKTKRQIREFRRRAQSYPFLGPRSKLRLSLQQERLSSIIYKRLVSDHSEALAQRVRYQLVREQLHQEGCSREEILAHKMIYSYLSSYLSEDPEKMEARSSE